MLIQVSGDDIEAAALDVCCLQLQRHDATLLPLELAGCWHEKMVQIDLAVYLREIRLQRNGRRRLEETQERWSRSSMLGFRHLITNVQV